MNGDDMINELNYREKLRDMPVDERDRLVAVWTFENGIKLGKHEKRLDAIEYRLPVKMPSRRRMYSFGSSVIIVVASLMYAIGNKCGWW